MHSPEVRERIARAAVNEGLIDSDERQVAAVIDLDHLSGNVAALHRAFPSDLPVLHAFAVKANAIPAVLGAVRQAGMGAEAASHGELSRALEAGHTPDRVVFDSPAKSRSELRRALGLGVALNVDNFQELARVRELAVESGATPNAGLRLNPQIGRGAILEMSTAGRFSKFGVPMQDPGMRERIAEAYLAHPWLTRVHSHVGSQGCPLDLLAEGVRLVVDLADEVNRRAGRAQVQTIDIGGGLPVDFESDSPHSRFGEYVSVLRERVPRLFSGDFGIVTEFGRSIIAKSGMLLSRVEYTKVVAGRRIATTHIGAQVATRTVFMPEAWPLRIEAYDGAGRLKRGGVSAQQDVAGPCCFAGDMIAQRRELPVLEPGDVVGVLDTGAYYASTPFDYNSLPLPGVYGARHQSGAVAFTTLREPADRLTVL